MAWQGKSTDAPTPIVRLIVPLNKDRAIINLRQRNPVMATRLRLAEVIPGNRLMTSPLTGRPLHPQNHPSIILRREPRPSPAPALARALWPMVLPIGMPTNAWGEIG